MSYPGSLRMVTCFLCNRKVTEKTAVRVGLGKHAGVNSWLCRKCAEDPEKARSRTR